jgi:RHH-type transcriptional regulator, rel operon repressor / antitoxin RelB
MTVSTTLVSFRVKNELKAKLDSLAEATQRSKSFLATEALERYIELESWQVGHIKKGIKQAEDGVVVSGEDVDRWLASWGTAKQLPPPKPQKRSRR